MAERLLRDLLEGEAFIRLFAGAAPLDDEVPELARHEFDGGDLTSPVPVHGGESDGVDDRERRRCALQIGRVQ